MLLIISEKDGSSIALEPSYFDKTNDYPTGHPEQDFFVTVQNCGVTLDHNGRKKLMTEDIRNGQWVNSQVTLCDTKSCGCCQRAY